MRMTLNDEVRTAGFRRLALTAAAALLAGALVTACGGGKDEEAAVAESGKAKVEKLREQKKGMMQQLLTGHVRLLNIK